MQSFKNARLFLLICILITFCFCAAKGQNQIEYQENDCFKEVPCNDKACINTQKGIAHSKLVIRYVSKFDTISPNCVVPYPESQEYEKYDDLSRHWFFDNTDPKETYVNDTIESPFDN